MSCLPPCLQVVVQQGLVPRAQELLANSTGLADAILGEQQRLGRGECWGSVWGLGSPAACQPG